MTTFHEMELRTDVAEKHQNLPYTDMSDNTEGTPKRSCKRTINAKK